MSVLAAIRGPRMRVLGLRAAYEKYGLDGQEEALGEGSSPTIRPGVASPRAVGTAVHR